MDDAEDGLMSEVLELLLGTSDLAQMRRRAERLVGLADGLDIQRRHGELVQQAFNNGGHPVANVQPMGYGDTGHLLLADGEEPPITLPAALGDEACILAHEVRVTPFIGGKRRWKR